MVNVATEVHGSAEDLVTVTDESHTLTTTVQLAFAPNPIGSVVVTNDAGTVTYAVTTDYTVSADGTITRVPSGSIGSGDDILVDYTHLPNFTVTDMKFTLTNPPYKSATPVLYSADGQTTYTASTDYSIDEYGRVTVVLGGAITNGQTVLAEYEVFDGLAASDIIGTASPRTGLYVYEEAFANFGYNPTIFISPDYDTVSGVWAALEAAANQYDAITIWDGPAGQTHAQIIAARGAAATGNFNVNSERVYLVHPRVGVYDAFSDGTEIRPASPTWQDTSPRLTETGASG